MGYATMVVIVSGLNSALGEITANRRFFLAITNLEATPFRAEKLRFHS